MVSGQDFVVELLLLFCKHSQHLHPRGSGIAPSPSPDGQYRLQSMGRESLLLEFLLPTYDPQTTLRCRDFMMQSEDYFASTQAEHSCGRCITIEP